MIKNFNELKIDHKNISFTLNGEDIGTSIEYLHIATYITSQDSGIIESTFRTKNATTIEPMIRRNYLRVLSTGVYLSHVAVPSGLKRYYTKILHGFLKINGENIEVFMQVTGTNFNICAEENVYYNLQITEKETQHSHVAIVQDYVVSTDMSDAPIVGDKFMNAIELYNSVLLDIPIVYTAQAIQ